MIVFLTNDVRTAGHLRAKKMWIPVLHPSQN